MAWFDEYAFRVKIDAFGKTNSTFQWPIDHDVNQSRTWDDGEEACG